MICWATSATTPADASSYCLARPMARRTPPGAPEPNSEAPTGQCTKPTPCNSIALAELLSRPPNAASSSAGAAFLLFTSQREATIVRLRDQVGKKRRDQGELEEHGQVDGFRRA